MSRLFCLAGPHRFWLGVFGFWLILLSGVLTPWTGGPGLLQWRRLETLLSQRQAQLQDLERQVLALSAEQVLLQRSTAAQQREIRRVLGYVRPDEMVFDFSVPEVDLPSAPASGEPSQVARR